MKKPYIVAVAMWKRNFTAAMYATSAGPLRQRREVTPSSYGARRPKVFGRGRVAIGRSRSLLAVRILFIVDNATWIRNAEAALSRQFEVEVVTVGRKVPVRIREFRP